MEKRSFLFRAPCALGRPRHTTYTFSKIRKLSPRFTAVCNGCVRQEKVSLGPGLSHDLPAAVPGSLIAMA